jgi:NTE family protein
MTKTGNRFDHEIRLLQGDGAGSIYHARVYEGMAEAGHALTCMVGVSIGVIIAALIAGNPPERRVERLRAFRERSSYAPLAWRAWVDAMRAAI